MVILLKLKATVGYKYVNMATVKYFEPSDEDNTKSVLYFEDGTYLLVEVDADLLGDEIFEIMEGFAFGEEADTNEDGTKKIKH
jgi:hypothetical protein